MKSFRMTVLGIVAIVALAHANALAQDVRPSVFYPPAQIAAARANAAKSAWGAQVIKDSAARGDAYAAMPDEAVWARMFGPTIRRAWQVWSNGYCPACKQPVAMYDWKMQFWKVECPHCHEQFPKNDFLKYYLSGMDEHYIFDPNKADKSLLFNTQHPDPKDPLHMFGVDDGDGYAADGHRWRFIGAYLIYGQWRQQILPAVRYMAEAYTATGDPKYAHKCGILLDRIADLYPSFDFGKQGVMYEGPGKAGYIASWPDACSEARELGIAYDEIRDGIAKDQSLADFLNAKAKQYKIDTPKAKPSDIAANIENHILKDSLASPAKIEANFPQTEITQIFLKAILSWPGNRDEILTSLDPIIAKTTSIDGVTGEKGLPEYTRWPAATIALMLGSFARAEPGFVGTAFKRWPSLLEMYKFWWDTWCLDSYYPRIGDSGIFGEKVAAGYAGATFSTKPAIDPSGYNLLWQAYEATHDPKFVQVLYTANAGKVDGLPFDFMCGDSAKFQSDVRDVVEKNGPEAKLGCVDKKNYHLAILRDGTGADRRALWMCYDSGGFHSHANGMNIGLYAYGLDLLPDFGYPPLQYGNYGSARSNWYEATAAHNTIAVDDKNQVIHVVPQTEDASYQGLPAGRTSLWVDSPTVKAVRANCPEMIEGQRFERTVAMVRIDDKRSYVVDVFRVVGGHSHARFMHSYYGTISSSGLNLGVGGPVGDTTVMRNFRDDAEAKPGWSVDWKLTDPNKYVPANADIHLKLTDFTLGGTRVTLNEDWISTTGYSGDGQAWIPAIAVGRKGEADLRSTFVSVIEPYTGASAIASIQRINQKADTDVVLEVTLTDGTKDLIVVGDTVRSPNEILLPENTVKVRGGLLFVRHAKDNSFKAGIVAQAKSLDFDGRAIDLKYPAEGWIALTP